MQPITINGEKWNLQIVNHAAIFPAGIPFEVQPTIKLLRVKWTSETEAFADRLANGIECASLATADATE